jgi:hypothetical protein
LIDQLPEQYQAPVDEVYPQWWQNLRSGGGMRLTDRGYDAFCNLLELQQYRYPLTGLDLQVLVLQSAMPVAVNTIVLVTEFGGDSVKVARTIVTTTLASLLTIPFILWLSS